MDDSGQQLQPDPRPRAAAAVWVAAAGLLLVGGCLSTSLAAIALVPADTLAANPAVAAMPEADRAQLLQMRTAAGPAALGAALVLVLPAAALLALGFGVRRGIARAAFTTRLVCLVLMVLLGVWTVAALAGGPAALPMALVQAGVVALLWRARRRLHPDRFGSHGIVGTAAGAPAIGVSDRRGLDGDNDPWDALL